MEQGLGVVRSGWRCGSGWSKKWVWCGVDGGVRVGGARSGCGEEW